MKHDFRYKFSRFSYPMVNIKQRIVYHSPTGFNWGYDGSGSADLALNVLDDALRRLKWPGRKITVGQVKCYELAWALHQDFKWHFIAQLPYQGGEIALSEICEWLEKYSHSFREYRQQQGGAV